MKVFVNNVWSHWVLLFSIGLLFGSCERESHIEAQISKIDVPVAVARFEQAFYGSDQPLDDLKRHYPYLFPKQYADSIWQQRRKDSLQQALFSEVNEKFEEFTQEAEMRRLFQHYQYYFPEKKAPKVLTLMSDVDYQNKVIFADSLLLIAVDTYLGSENMLYDGISAYQRTTMSPEYLMRDIADAMTQREVPNPQSRSFLAKMIYHGKRHYMKDLLIPHKTDWEKIGFTASDLAWAQENEQYIWKYFIENDLLYQTDPKLSQRFIDEAPFSKFFLEFDQESPGRIGQWMGWQIVRAFNKNNDVSLQTFLALDAETIFNKSKYKPKK